MIATKNREKYLPNALQSCFLQSVSPLEIVIIDDGSDSPDQIQKIVKDFSARLNITLLRNEVSLGQGESRNIGAKVAKGTLVAFLDDDNFLLSNHLELCLAQLKHPEVVAACSFMNVIETDQLVEQNSKVDYVMIFAGTQFGALNYFYNLICDTHIVIRREHFLKIGGFPALIRSSQEDWALGLKIMNSDFILKSTGVPTIMYRKNSDGIYATVTGLSKWWPLHVSSQRVNINGWWFTELARLRIVEKGKLQETINYVKWLLEHRLYGLLLARICRFVWRNTFLKLRNFFR